MTRLNFENIVRLSNERQGKKLKENGVERIDVESLRRFQVERARDLIAEPLSVKEFLRHPFLARSRWLISGYDVDANQSRTFYIGKAGLLKLALYEPGSSRPKWSLPRPFGPTSSERTLLIDSLAECAKRGPTNLLLRIYCDDLRLIA